MFQKLKSVSITCIVCNVKSRHQNDVCICPLCVFLNSYPTSLGLLNTESTDLRTHFLKTFQGFLDSHCFYAIMVIKHDVQMH